MYIRSNFNPRSPHRERRACDGNFEVQVDISIHAPLTGSDLPGLCQKRLLTDFNPRSPHRERLVTLIMWLFVPEFQSTLPSQGATLYDCYDTYAKIFQSTLPSQGATKIQPCRERMCKFQSTLPSQGATSYNHVRLFNSRISIHAPLTGSDANALVEQIMEQNFNPRSPHRERL